MLLTRNRAQGRLSTNTMLLRSTFEQIEIKQSVTMKSNKYSLFSTFRELSVNRKDLQAIILVGPTRPLVVLHLDN